jgi:hypothetical protein
MRDATEVGASLGTGDDFDLTTIEMTTLERVAANEWQAFDDYSDIIAAPRGRLDLGLTQGPDPQTGGRLLAEMCSQHSDPEADGRFRSFASYAFFALTGYSAGVRSLTQMDQLRGLTKAQILEGLGIAFIHGGPRGMETIADALRDYEWIAPERSAQFPVGWGVDPEAFRSGLDYSTWTLSAEEVLALEAWYERWLGEVPRYVPFLAKYLPVKLKTHRYRYENLIRVLPKQVLPMTLLSYNVVRRCAEGIRENTLLAKGFGVTKADVLGQINQALINAGPDAIDVADRAVGNVLEAWA